MNYQGFLTPGDTNSQFNQIQFLIAMALGKLNTAMPVEVMAVTNDGGVSPVGFVDVRPMVNQVTADGTAVPHQTIYGIPYFRLQGGANAIILDPQVGDIGTCLFADRDISVVKKTKAVSMPGSFRQHSMADGLYLGGFLNGTPEQFVRFSASGIDINSPTAITMEAPTVTMTAPTVTVDGNLIVTGDINGTNITASAVVTAGGGFATT